MLGNWESPVVHEVYELAIERLVRADTAREIPRMNERVGGHLPAVLGNHLLTARKRHRSLERARRAERGQRVRHCRVPHRNRIVTQLIAVETAANVNDA